MHVCDEDRRELVWIQSNHYVFVIPDVVCISSISSEADVVCISSISSKDLLNVSAGTSGGDAAKMFSAATRHFSAYLRTYETHALKERNTHQILSSYSAFPRIRNKRDLQGSEQAMENRV